MWAVEKFGRKPLLTWGGLGMSLSHIGVFLFLTLSNNIKGFAWGAIISVYFFIFFFASTWGPTVWSYQAEIFPMRIRAKASSIGTMTNWIFNAVIGFGFPPLFEVLNKEPKSYWIFAAFCFGMFLWAMFFIPETKGKSLEEIDEVFNGQTSPPTEEEDFELQVDGSKK